jgi:hypothetical protein
MNKPGENLGISSPESLFLAIENETEWLQTTEGDEVECISIENLLGILKQFFKNNPQIQ